MQMDCTTGFAVEHHYQLHVPERRGDARLPLFIGLHGYAGDMASMMRLTRAIAGEEMIAASLQGPHEFWVPSMDSDTRRVAFGWLTPFRPADSQARHHEFVRRVIEEAGARHGADTDRVFLMGFSQACAMNYRLVFARPEAFRGVIGVCGGIPGDFDDSKYRPFAGGVLHIAATQDQYYSLERSRGFEPALRRLASDVSFREYESPHAFPRRSLPHIRQWTLDRC